MDADADTDGGRDEGKNWDWGEVIDGGKYVGGEKGWTHKSKQSEDGGRDVLGNIGVNVDAIQR